jgi:hypothetical protein
MITPSRLFACIACVALTTYIYFDREPISQISKQHISGADRDAAVESLKHADIAKTAPRILRLMRDNVSPSEPGFDKPWMSPHYSHRAKVWYASGAVWTALFSGSNDPSKAKILLELLGDNHDEYSQYVVLNQLRFHWNSEVETEVSALARRKNITNDTKELAISVLLECAGDSYVPDALRFVQDAASEDQSFRFHPVFNIGNRFETFSQKSQADILTLGFSILEAESKPGTSAGYEVACQLGTFLRVPEEFKPNSHAPEYQGRGGLNENFFFDTVINALEWRRRNPSAFTAKP